MSFFWRSFLLIVMLLLGNGLAWLQTFRSLEWEPRAIQSARQLASLVNLTRAGLKNSDEIARLAWVKTLIDEEDLRITEREPTDTYTLLDDNPFAKHVTQLLQDELGSETVLANEMNGYPGMWIGFAIGKDSYWLLADPSRLETVQGTTWMIWLGIAAIASLLGAAVIAYVMHQPLKQLLRATQAVGHSQIHAIRLDETVTTPEIRKLNIGFNSMLDRLAQTEQDRLLMLAGISHDLRTPLARLRLEAEMSVSDLTAKQYMVQDIEQVDAIIGQFLDYARTDAREQQVIHVHDALKHVLERTQEQNPFYYTLTMDEKETLWVLCDPLDLQRCLLNLVQNALRYGITPSTKQVDMEVTASHQKTTDGILWVTITLRDHGDGVPLNSLKQLTNPFYRVDDARTITGATGLGLSIVKRCIERNGGRLELHLAEGGGLAVTLWLKQATV